MSIGNLQIDDEARVLDKSNMKDLAKVVGDRLAELDRNPFEAARKGGLERSFVNDILIEKKKSVHTKSLEKLARGLDWPVARLLDMASLPEKSMSVVKVVGRIGAGASVLPEFDQTDPDALFEIETDLPVSDDALAFEVEGDSMYPRYDPGDVIICGVQATNPSQIVGWEAAVLTADGNRYLKRVRAGSAPGLFNLESHNASPIRDVKIQWAAQVDQVIRAGKWRALDREARSRLVARTLPKR